MGLIITVIFYLAVSHFTQLRNKLICKLLRGLVK